MSKLQCRGVIFDLDGTLLDTLVDIANAANDSLRQEGVPEHSLDRYRVMVGDGVRVLFQRAVPDEFSGVRQECMENFERHYASRLSEHSKPYPGIPELLSELAIRGLWMGILSNKPHHFTQRCVEALLAGHRFASVIGQRPDVPRKPDPYSLLEMLRGMEAAPKEVLYVGDTDTDMKTAVAAGCPAVGVTWGFRTADELLRTGARYVIHRPAELLGLVASA